MSTYNKYIGLSWEAQSSTLIIGTATTTSFSFTNNSVLENLKDNIDGYIIPKYLRDMFISTWDSIVFKPTIASGSSTQYIGIDSGIGDDLLEKPNRDLVVNKIFLGKKSYSGTYSYSESNDIMTSELLSSDIDLFFYNTRPDTLSQDNTRIILLAGTNQLIYNNAPYIQSQITTTTGGSQSLTLDIFNSSGDIILLSQGIDSLGNNISSGGNIYINDISFPSIGTSSYVESSVGIDKNNLIYRDGELVWDKISFPQTDYIGITGSRISINGDLINANSHSLDFTDIRPCPIKIGDVSVGTTFDRMSIADVLRKIIYPYLPPKCTISLANSTGYVEVGTYPNISINYTITKKTENTLPTRLINMIPSTYPKITTPGENTISGVSRGIMVQPVTATTSLFEVNVTDGTSNSIATASVSGIYPYFYGFTSSNNLTVSALSSMTKLVEPKGDKIYDLTGSGNFFFAYDADYGPLSSIYNDLNIDIIATFSSSVNIISSPTGLWSSKEYLVYKWENVSQIGPPSEIFEFKY